MAVRFTAARMDKFIELFAESHAFIKSSRGSGVAPQTVRDALKRDPDFVARYEEAKEIHYEAITEEVFRRGKKGIDIPLSFQGRLTGDIIKGYSDNLLTMYAKRYIAEFKDKSFIEQNTTHGGTIAVPVPNIDMKALPRELREKLSAVIDELLQLSALNKTKESERRTEGQ